MNFKEIIKQEWEAEFPDAAILCTYENSLAVIYEQMVERICVRVWNEALEQAAEKAEWGCFDDGDGGYTEEIDKQSILKLKINEQGTDTTEV